MKENFCYIHIPFCTSKCKYCRFASYWILDSLKVDLYVKNLLKEIENNKTDFNDLKSVYFGWWTPSILSISNLEKIFNKLKQNFSFDKNIEITLEATPITITKQNLIWWKKFWINRLSIWVQTLNNDALIEIWRGEKWDIINALDEIKTSPHTPGHSLLSKLNSPWPSPLEEREQEQFSISIDFIIWLPYVKKWEIKKDIEFILENYDFIKHISVYMLEEYYEINSQSTPLLNWEESKFENITYPNNWSKLWIKDEDYLWEYIEISDFLKEKWFNKYEISNFAKKWYECKHNKAYWNHSNIFAFWLWAHWLINSFRYSNSEDFLKYYSFEYDFSEKLTSNDIFLEKLMFWLRTSWIDKEIYQKLDKKKLDYLLENNYLKKLGDKIILSPSWVLVLDYILRELV